MEIVTRSKNKTFYKLFVNFINIKIKAQMMREVE